jgi:hypothetical protein
VYREDNLFNKQCWINWMDILMRRKKNHDPFFTPYTKVTRDESQT